MFKLILSLKIFIIILTYKIREGPDGDYLALQKHPDGAC